MDFEYLPSMSILISICAMIIIMILSIITHSSNFVTSWYAVDICGHRSSNSQVVLRLTVSLTTSLQVYGDPQFPMSLPSCFG